MHALVLALLAAAPQTFTFTTDGTPKVEAAVVDGSIRVEAVDGDRVTVEARQEGSAEELRGHPLEVVQDGDTVRARVCCGPCAEDRDRERKGKKCRDVPETHFVVRVPRQGQVSCASVDGSIEVKGVKGEVEAATVNGEVSVSGTEGKLEVATVDGDVRLSPGVVAATSVATVSGDVALKLPRNADAQLEFSAVSGKYNGKSVNLGSSKETFGKGTHEIEIGTVSGDLDVR